MMLLRHTGIRKPNLLLFLVWGIWLFCLLFSRKWHILGPVSFRNFAGMIIVPVAMFMSCRTILTNTIKIYLLWNFYYIIINSLNGYDVFLTNNYIAYNIISFCIIYAIPKLVKDIRTLDIIIIWFVVFYILNSCLTIFQFFNNSIAWEITNYIAPISESEMLQYSYYENEESLLSQSLCSGLNGFVVANGRFIAGFLPIATFLIWHKNKREVFAGICIMCLGLISAFCTQQRMCFLLVILFILYFLYSRLNIGLKIVLFMMGLFIVVFFADMLLLDSSNYGRLLSADSNGRSQTLEMTDMYFTNWDYFLRGNMAGDSYSHKMLMTMGHNCFLDALRRGGIISFALYTYMFFEVTFELKNVIISSKKNSNYFAACFAMSSLLVLLYSFTHSENIMGGSIFFWLSYSLMHACLRKEAMSPQN